MPTKRLSYILEQCRIMTSNASDTSIAEFLLPYGYTPERLLEGVNLYKDTALAFQIQKKEYTDQYYATNAFITAFDLARKTLSMYAKIARIAFKNNIEGLRLIPLTLKVRAYSDFANEANRFYGVVLASEELLALLQQFGVTRAIFEAELSNLAALEGLSQKRFVEEGEAQVATTDRDRKLELLREYCSNLRTIAKIAFADNPQQAEKLGILARNGKPPKKKEETPPPAPKS